jgi:hypothetical protein
MTVILTLMASIGLIGRSSQAADSSKLLLDYPELKITATGTKFDLPPEVEADRYLVTLDNQGEEGLDAQFVQVPKGRSVDELAKALDDPNEATAWLFDATWAGGPTVLAGNQGQTIVDLAAGKWAVIAEGYAPFALSVSPVIPYAHPMVDPVSAATIELSEYGFKGLTDNFKPGKQVWKVTNTGDQPHFLELVKAPGPVTVDQVMDALMSTEDPNAVPAAGALDLETIEGVGGIGTISPGRTGWYVTDLEPGTYVALCFVPDRESGMPHVMMGMVGVFTISETA